MEYARGCESSRGAACRRRARRGTRARFRAAPSAAAQRSAVAARARAHPRPLGGARSVAFRLALLMLLHGRLPDGRRSSNCGGAWGAGRRAALWVVGVCKAWTAPVRAA